ncbi:MAG: hypothetical protein NC117_02520 [Pseudoflavonifractor sp.]|nr:hypothetical protein [Pseudoflavonifractor sp.]
MVSICDHIEYLIGCHDCVVVPGLGAFVAQYQSARVDTVAMAVVPPSRSVAFNPSINHNDGLLVTSVMRRESVTYDKAEQVVTREVEAMRHQLEADGEVSVGRLGLMRRNVAGSPIFVPSALDYVSGRYYGLQPVKAVPVIREVREAAVAAAVTERRHDVIYLPISRNIFKIAASVALILGLGFTLSTPVIVDRSADSYASIASMPEHGMTQTKIKERRDAELFISIPGESTTETDTAMPFAAVDMSEPSGAQVVGDATVAVEARVKDAAGAMEAHVKDTAIARNNRADENNPDAGMLRIEEGDPYCLVVASHATLDQARRQIGSRSDMRILQSGGRYRVYVATGRTSAQAKEPMADPDFAARYPGAWVCRR